MEERGEPDRKSAVTFGIPATIALGATLTGVDVWVVHPGDPAGPILTALSGVLLALCCLFEIRERRRKRG